MGQCAHTSHSWEVVPYNTPNNKTTQVRMFVGWNPVHGRHEFCERGLERDKPRDARTAKPRRLGDWENQDLTSTEVVERGSDSPGTKDKAPSPRPSNASSQTRRFLKRAEQRKAGIPAAGQSEPAKV